MLKEEKLNKKTGFRYRGQDMVIVRAAYSDNDNTALLVETADGAAYACATVNIMRLPPNLAAIKEYSENKGMLSSLMEQGIVSEPKSYVKSGYVIIPVCEIISPELL